MPEILNPALKKKELATFFIYIQNDKSANQNYSKYFQCSQEFVNVTIKKWASIAGLIEGSVEFKILNNSSDINLEKSDSKPPFKLLKDDTIIPLKSLRKFNIIVIKSIDLGKFIVTFVSNAFICTIFIFVCLYVCSFF